MIDLPHRPTLFIDRNSGGRTFRDLIAEAGIKVVLHDEHFTDNKTPDEVWLKAIGDLGWIMITGDIATSRSLLFLAILKRSSSRVFILEGLNHATREGKAKCVIESYDAIIRVSKKYPPPLLWRINAEGKPISINFREKLGLMRRAEKKMR